MTVKIKEWWAECPKRSFLSLSPYFSCCRFLYERHEQSKQDLKGLEETVVSGFLLCLIVGLGGGSVLLTSSPSSPLPTLSLLLFYCASVAQSA